MTVVRMLSFDTLLTNIEHHPENMAGIVIESATVTTQEMKINEERFLISAETEAQYDTRTQDGRQIAAITARYRVIFQVDTEIDGYSAEKAEAYLKQHPTVLEAASTMLNMFANKDLTDLRMRHNIATAIPLAEMTVS